MVTNARLQGPNLHLVGDVHGRIDEYLKLLASLPPGSRSIALGDLYIGRPNINLPILPANHKFIRGNHDDPRLCHTHPNHLGTFGYNPKDDFFFLEGAFTVSAAVLQHSRYFYKDEELSPEELDAAVALYRETEPSIVISHDAPIEAAREVLKGLTGNYFTAKANTVKSRTCSALRRMFEIHKPQRWYFGHYHVHKQFDLSGTAFRCLGELEACEVPLVFASR
jgi:hypothetical protein